MPLVLAIALLTCLVLFYFGRNWLGWVAPGVIVLLGWHRSAGGDPSTTFFAVSVAFGAIALVGGIRPVRRVLVTSWLLPRIAPILPRMSETERTAIEAGTVWWEAEFFTGRPDWRKLLNFNPQELSQTEVDFLEGPVEEVCKMVDDWDVRRQGDMPPEVWEYLKKKGFMGMIIPTEYGGLGFSAIGHSAVITKLSSHSTAAAVTAMVPNSLGPAELLLHYGTQEQKDHYLPRLANGDDIPAFALTEPNAGSDAGGMTSRGVVCEGQYKGEKVLGMRLTWDKRYITLAPVATVLGLAFKLYDPDHLLGYQEDLGITCALVPTEVDGVEVGHRHDPLGTAFMNGPTRGRDVFVPLDFIIGGKEMAGKGWMMLMQSLAAGRGISLPSMATAAGMLSTRTTGAYATVREQFKMPIGRFEGIQERLARISALTYAMDASRRLTAGAVDAGEKPSVASAIVKCYLTEAMRTVTNDAMDVVGGAGICQGPRNVIGGMYSALPIGITVEGANILTRSMIIFGQGAIRCHPFVQDEMRGASEKDVEVFDRAFFGHVGFVFQNMSRSFLLGLTNGALSEAPVTTPVAPIYRRLTRMSASFALAADVAMGTLGGALKRKEAITGRLADCLSWMYIASAALKRFNAEGAKERDLPYVTWVGEYALHQCQEAYKGVIQNLPFRPAAWLLRFLAFPLGARWNPPSDRLSHLAARGILNGGEARLHLTQSMYVPEKEEVGLGLLEKALVQAVEAQAVHGKIREAVKQKRLERKPASTLVQRALEAKVISEDDKKTLAAADKLRSAAVAVDSFPKQSYSKMTA